MNIRKEDIISGVNILDIAAMFKIRVERVSSGNFTHRCCCPSQNHKGGRERTSSLYIDSINNNFYCYGCLASHNSIDFHILCDDSDFLTALSALAPMVDQSKIDKSGKIVIKASILGELMAISEFFRKLQVRFGHDIEWIEMVMKKTDAHIEGLERTDVPGAKRLLRNIKTLCKGRYSK